MNRQPVPITITKADWLTAQHCPVMAWHDLRPGASLPPDEAALFGMQQGAEIGELAQQLYPEGVLVSKALGKTTEQLVADKTVKTFFELPFRAGALAARPDIARRHGNGWHMLEVKSSFADNKADGLVDDLAFTVMGVPGWLSTKHLSSYCPVLFAKARALSSCSRSLTLRRK